MSKIAGYTIAMKFGTPLAEKGVYDAKLSQKADEIDVTDSMSAGNSKEFIAGLVDRTVTFSMWFRDDENDRMTIGDVKAFEMIFVGKKFSGTLIITSDDIDGSLKDAVKVNYTARISGVLAFGSTSAGEPG
jgi:predicted secreted protein